jgi:uncharacterized protein (DUF302 family)
MTVRQVPVERFSIVSTKPFEDVIAAISAAVGHPDITAFWKEMAAAKSWQELENAVNAVVGPSGFLEFARFNHGQILEKDLGAAAPKIVRLVVGNPLIMKRMAEHVPDAGAYAPVTILVDERADGVHLSYDHMASFLAPYGDSPAMVVARNLDAKVEEMLEAAGA